MSITFLFLAYPVEEGHKKRCRKAYHGEEAAIDAFDE